MSVWSERSRVLLAAHFADVPPWSIGTIGTIAPDEPPIVPIVPNVQTLEIAERAAIIQEGAKVPADWADGFARLEALPTPRGVDGAAWQAMLDAAGRFLDQWAGHAHALGWTAGELFALDLDSPFGRRDRRGGAFYLTHGEVVAITAEAITLKTGGAIQSIRRRDGFAVPAWEAVA